MSVQCGSASQLHHLMLRTLIDTGSCPSNEELGQALGVSQSELIAMLRHLEEAHGIVLHPDRASPWVIHPFSLTPTATWVQGPGPGWWAPCLWCAFGIAALVGGGVQFHTRLAGETEPVVISARDAEPLPADADEYCLHFAIRPADAWNNVHAHCAMILPFRTERGVRDWAARHRLPLGEVVPLRKAAALARRWYGSHADPQWRKWTIDEAQAIFHAAGLRSEFWNLGAPQGRF